MDDEDSEKKCLSTQHGTDINIIKLSYNSPPVSEEVERFKLMRWVFKKVFVFLIGREVYFPSCDQPRTILKTISREIEGHHWLHFSSDNFDKGEFKRKSLLHSAKLSSYDAAREI